MMKTNGWVNASKMCTDGGKKFHDWMRLQGTKELFAEYERLKVSEITTDIKAEADNTCRDGKAVIPALPINSIMRVQACKSTAEGKLIAGTYCPADLIPSVAGWISPDFQLKANRIINHYLVSEYMTKLAESERAGADARAYNERELARAAEKLTVKRSIGCG